MRALPPPQAAAIGAAIGAAIAAAIAAAAAAAAAVTAAASASAKANVSANASIRFARRLEAASQDLFWVRQPYQQRQCRIEVRPAQMTLAFVEFECEV